MNLAGLWRGHRLLVLAFAAALALTVLLAVRTLLFTLHWSDPARQDQAIAGWMTPRYVALSWDVPSEVVAGALELDRDGSGRRITLAELADGRGVPVADLAAALDRAIAAHRAGR